MCSIHANHCLFRFERCQMQYKASIIYLFQRLFAWTKSLSARLAWILLKMMNILSCFCIIWRQIISIWRPIRPNTYSNPFCLRGKTWTKEILMSDWFFFFKRLTFYIASHALRPNKWELEMSFWPEGSGFLDIYCSRYSLFLQRSVHIKIKKIKILSTPQASVYVRQTNRHLYWICFNLKA